MQPADLACSLTMSESGARLRMRVKLPDRFAFTPPDGHRMALTFRSYLGLSSQWAITGEAARQADFQIWCGPAMGAFNRWVADAFLADPAQRTVDQIALNLLEGAAVVTRAQQLRCFGVPVPAAVFDYRPRRLE